MSQTVRISDELYDAIDEYRDKDESFQDIIEEMADEFGLVPDTLQTPAELERKLRSTYSYSTAEAQMVLDALQYVYIGEEKPESIGVPHAFADANYEDEIDALIRLDLVSEEHYTGKYDYGYRTTSRGAEVASELVRNHMDQHEGELHQLLDGYDEVFLGVIIQFGFEKTDSGHFTDRGATLAGAAVPPLWDIDELLTAYRKFISELKDLNLAVQYGTDIQRTVVAPEFRDYLQTRVDPDTSAMMATVEVYQTLLDYTHGDLSTREELIDRLDFATEDQLAEEVDAFHKAGLTSNYQPNQETPFLIRDSGGVEQRIETELMDALGVPTEP
ncbi:hypothetical protein [Salinadaptatus halalkaliphilus]|nr:hypothetical protein [Salinadaptatus halalkaliphilus]